MGARAMARALDLDDNGVVDQVIGERGCDDRIAEDLAPLGEAPVGCEERAMKAATGSGPMANAPFS